MLEGISGGREQMRISARGSEVGIEGIGRRVGVVSSSVEDRYMTEEGNRMKLRLGIEGYRYSIWSISSFDCFESKSTLKS